MARISNNGMFRISNVLRKVGPGKDNQDNDVMTVRALIHLVCLNPTSAGDDGWAAIPDPTSTTMDRKTGRAIRRYQDTIAYSLVASDGVNSPIKDNRGMYDTGTRTVLKGNLIWTLSHLNDYTGSTCLDLGLGADHVDIVCTK